MSAPLCEFYRYKNDCSVALPYWVRFYCPGFDRVRHNWVELVLTCTDPAFCSGDKSAHATVPDGNAWYNPVVSSATGLCTTCVKNLPAHINHDEVEDGQNCPYYWVLDICPGHLKTAGEPGPHTFIHKERTCQDHPCNGTGRHIQIPENNSSQEPLIRTFFRTGKCWSCRLKDRMLRLYKDRSRLLEIQSMLITPGPSMSYNRQLSKDEWASLQKEAKQQLLLEENPPNDFEF